MALPAVPCAAFPLWSFPTCASFISWCQQVAGWPCYSMEFHHPRHNSTTSASPDTGHQISDRCWCPPAFPLVLLRELWSLSLLNLQPSCGPFFPGDQGTALRPPSPHLLHDGQKILLAWSCRATQSLTTGGYCSFICPVLFPLWLDPGSNLFITIDRTHPR